MYTLVTLTRLTITKVCFIGIKLKGKCLSLTHFSLNSFLNKEYKIYEYIKKSTKENDVKLCA